MKPISPSEPSPRPRPPPPSPASPFSAPEDASPHRRFRPQRVDPRQLYDIMHKLKLESPPALAGKADSPPSSRELRRRERLAKERNRPPLSVIFYGDDDVPLCKDLTVYTVGIGGSSGGDGSNKKEPAEKVESAEDEDKKFNSALEGLLALSKSNQRPAVTVTKSQQSDSGGGDDDDDDENRENVDPRTAASGSRPPPQQQSGVTVSLVSVVTDESGAEATFKVPGSPVKLTPSQRAALR